MRENIRGWLYAHGREMVLGVIVFITASLSFGLGYLADQTFNHAPIIIETCSASHVP